MSPDWRRVQKRGDLCDFFFFSLPLVCVYVRVGVWRSLRQQLLIMSANSRPIWTVSAKHTANRKQSDVLSEPLLVASQPKLAGL